jgi:hypothetical protein
MRIPFNAKLKKKEENCVSRPPHPTDICVDPTLIQKHVDDTGKAGRETESMSRLLGNLEVEEENTNKKRIKSKSGASPKTPQRKRYMSVF